MSEVFILGELPGPDTPLPPSNATRHVRLRETGYGTAARTMTMLCGVVWTTSGWKAEGEHKWFGLSETWWHKHVNCPDCLQALTSERRQG